MARNTIIQKSVTDDGRKVFLRQVWDGAAGWRHDWYELVDGRWVLAQQPTGEFAQPPVETLTVKPTPKAHRVRRRCVRTTDPVGIDWESQPLGKMSDEALGRRLGVGVRSVWHARQVRNIAPHNKPGDSANVGIVWDEQPLGKLSDAQIARELGVSTTSVLSARRVRGIEPWKPER